MGASSAADAVFDMNWVRTLEMRNSTPVRTYGFGFEPIMLTTVSAIILPAPVFSIADATQRNAFYGCKTLKRISIPAAVTAIGDDAFYNTALSDVYYGGTEEQWSAITIGSSNQRLTNAARHYNSPSF